MTALHNQWAIREVWFDEDGNPTAHRAAPQPSAEPVAWMVTDIAGRRFLFRLEKPVVYEGETLIPLYPAPQPAKRVPLTDEELRDALRQCPHDTIENLRVRWLYAKDFARAIEAAHGITGEQE